VIGRGDIIETPEGASVQIVIGNDMNKIVKVDEKTRMEVQGVNPTVLNISLGKVLVSVKKLEPKSSFVVKTPVAICGARGTSWSQESAGDVTKICVFENDVFVKKLDASGIAAKIDPAPLIKKRISNVLHRGES